MRHVIGMKVRYVLNMVMSTDMKQIGKNMYIIRKYVHFQNKVYIKIPKYILKNVFHLKIDWIPPYVKF